MPQLEGPTTKNIQLCTGGFGEKKEKKKDNLEENDYAKGRKLKKKTKTIIKILREIREDLASEKQVLQEAIQNRNQEQKKRS